MRRLNHIVLFASIICLLMVAVVEAKIIIIQAGKSGDFPTIQKAIDAAQNGDEIVLEMGIYTGQGNRDLNYKGKAITIRSRYPDDNDCMRNTIIDAQGQGVIVRFINDEGPGSVFEGFTLGAGDILKQVRGDPGFFEFSPNARPTTRRLRNLVCEYTRRNLILDTFPVSISYDTIYPGEIAPAGLVWDGSNPFHQPATTTDYHGSGDVDGDGSLTLSDVDMAQNMADGNTPWINRADVDGNGDVNAVDVTLINNAISGGILGSWWNQLTTTEQRNSWLDKILELEKTDKYTYYTDYFVCHHFAYQTFIHCSFMRADFPTEYTEYDGGQTVFNIPMYYVRISPPTNHAINSVLVGDNPLNFNDWRFIEPQDDGGAEPGRWNMRYNSYISMFPKALHVNVMSIVVFYVDETGWTLDSYKDDLVLTRPSPPSLTPDNRPDLWNPRIVSAGCSGFLLFERMREDMFRTTNIHLMEFPFTDPPESEPAVLNFNVTRLLDITQGPDGKFHILWEGRDGNYMQSLYHGIFEPVTRKLTNVTKVIEGFRYASMGRVIVTMDNEVHILWYENGGYKNIYEYGIHWTKLINGTWQTPQNLIPDAAQVGDSPDWLLRQFARYVFDVSLLDDGRIMLIWVEVDFPQHYISQLIYDGNWHSSRIQSTGWDYSLRGLDLCRAPDGKIHLAYWRGDRQDSYTGEEGRGDVFHKVFDGISWNNSTKVDDSLQSCCTQVAAGSDGEIYMIWERKQGNHVLPVWSKYEDGTWDEPQVISIPADANAWYPDICVFRDGRVYTAWSERSDQRVAIGSELIEDGEWMYVPVSYPGDFDVDFDVDFNDFTYLASTWNNSPDDALWNNVCDIGYLKDDFIDYKDLKMLISYWLIEGHELGKYTLYDDFETGDFSKYPWEHAGQADWQISLQGPYNGLYSAKSGYVMGYNESNLQISLNIPDGSNAISFYWKLECGVDWSYFRFYIDDELKSEWTGMLEWDFFSHPLTSGPHTLKWTYKKEGNVFIGESAVWIDQVTID